MSTVVCPHYGLIRIGSARCWRTCSTTRCATLQAAVTSRSQRPRRAGNSPYRWPATGEGGELTITVADDGDGIVADQLPHVFERFYRVDAARDREHGGAGIGLAIAKALAEAHDGRISAASGGLGTGTTFIVTLPVRRD